MDDKPEIPDPQRAPEDEPAERTDTPTGEPHLNGTSHMTDNDKLIAWMKATDKELKVMRLTQLVLCGAVLMLLVTAAKNGAVKPLG